MQNHFSECCSNLVHFTGAGYTESYNPSTFERHEMGKRYFLFSFFFSSLIELGLLVDVKDTSKGQRKRA